MKLWGFTLSYWQIGLCLVGLLLALDAVALFVMGKMNVGTVIPLLIGGWLLIHGLHWQEIGQYLQAHSGFKTAWQLVWAGFLLWLVSFMAFVIVLKQAIDTGNHAMTQITFSPKAVLTLGSGFKDGKPTPVLASRLDKTAELEKIYPNALLVLTGGVDLNETQSEAEVMANYLQQHYAISPAKMRLEDKSTSTELNLQNSQPILTENGIGLGEPIAIVTSDFHTLRAKAIAKKQGYSDVQTFGSITPLSIRYNAWLREYFAFVSGWILKEY